MMTEKVRRYVRFDQMVKHREIEKEGKEYGKEKIQ